MNKNFSDFVQSTSLTTGDFLVGYNQGATSEFRSTFRSIAEALRPYMQSGGTTPTPTPTQNGATPTPMPTATVDVALEAWRAQYTNGKRWFLGKAPDTENSAPYGTDFVDLKSSVDPRSGKDVFIAIYSGTRNHLAKSTDGGKTWEKISTSFLFSPDTIQYGNNIFVITCKNGTILTSQDAGDTWQKQAFFSDLGYVTSSSSGYRQSLVFAQGKFFALFSPPDNFRGFENYVYSSVDGANWTRLEVLNTHILNYTYVPGPGATGLLDPNSPPSHHWSLQSANNKVILNITKIFGLRDSITARASSISFNAIYLYDGNVIKLVNSNKNFYDIAPSDIQYSPDRATYACANGNAIYTSDNLQDWNRVDSNQLAGIFDVGVITYSPNDKKFKASSAQRHSETISSDDGFTWSALATPAINTTDFSFIHSIEYPRGLEVGLIGGTWSGSRYKNIGYFGHSTLPEKNFPAPQQIQHIGVGGIIEYANGVFLSLQPPPTIPSVANGGDQTCSIYRYQNSLSNSPTKIPLPVIDDQENSLEKDSSTYANNRKPWTSLVYGNGTWVATRSSSTRVAYSKDNGLTWVGGFLLPLIRSGINNNISRYTNSTFLNGQFIALTESGTLAATSTDGINWATITLGTAQGVTSNDYITYKNGIYLASGFSTSVGIYSGNTLENLTEVADPFMRINGGQSVVQLSSLGKLMTDGYNFITQAGQMVSQDGRIWTQPLYSPSNIGAFAKAKFIKDTVVCFSTSSTSNLLFYSDPGSRTFKAITTTTPGIVDAFFNNGKMTLLGEDTFVEVPVSPDPA